MRAQGAGACADAEVSGTASDAPEYLGPSFLMNVACSCCEYYEKEWTGAWHPTPKWRPPRERKGRASLQVCRGSGNCILFYRGCLHAQFNSLKGASASMNLLQACSGTKAHGPPQHIFSELTRSIFGWTSPSWQGSCAGSPQVVHTAQSGTGGLPSAHHTQ